MGVLQPNAGFGIWIAIMIASWVIPLILLIWLIRSVNAMVAAQRQIAEHLKLIANAVSLSKSA